MAWFRSLKRPRMQMPFWVWLVVAPLVYIMDEVIICRLIALDIPRDGRIACLTAIGAAMLLGEFWNYLFFSLPSPLAEFAMLTACLPVFVVLETALFLCEPICAYVLMPYALCTLCTASRGACGCGNPARWRRDSRQSYGPRRCSETALTLSKRRIPGSQP